LGRVVIAYGSTPEFVLLGGLVPDLLCTEAAVRHEGTTDVDVQVDLEIAGGSANAAHLEAALRSAGFVPDDQRAWRWHDHRSPEMVVKAEFLTDLDDVPNQTTVIFDACERLGAINLRGTGLAARNWESREISVVDETGSTTINLRVTGLAGYLLAKTHAAYGRRARKDWYDVAYVLLHNDRGGPSAAAADVRQRFLADLVGQTDTDGARRASEQLRTHVRPRPGGIRGHHARRSVRPRLGTLTNDAVAAVDEFVHELRLPRSS